MQLARSAGSSLSSHNWNACVKELGKELDGHVNEEHWVFVVALMLFGKKLDIIGHVDGEHWVFVVVLLLQKW